MNKRRWFHLGSVDDTVSWEIEHHLAERIDTLMEQGYTRAEAEAEARRVFGDVSGVQRAMREESGERERRARLRLLLDAVRLDARDGLRRLQRSPGYAAVAILVLGLGIGANTAIFSALQHALLREAPYRESDRLVLVDMLLQRNADEPADTMPWSYPKFQAVRDALSSVASVAAYSASTVTLTGMGDAARLGLEFVSPSYFDVLGVQARAGRAFGAEQDTRAGSAVAVLAHHTWMTRFGGATSVLGQTITLDNTPIEIIGVAPQNFRGLTGGADVFMPIEGIAAIRGPRRLELTWAHWLRVVGRLEDGSTLAQAQQRVLPLGAQLTEAYPDPSGGGAHGVTIVSMNAARVNPVARLAVTAVGIAAALLLLIACANVASLMIARTNARRSDFAVRAALGAGRGRLVRASLVESLLVAAGGGLLGVVLAFAGQPLVVKAVEFALQTTGTRSLQFLDTATITLDRTVLLAGIALTLLTGLLAGLLPAWSAGRTDVAHDLRSGARLVRDGAAGELAMSGRGMLVAAQLALTLVLLAGSGLMAASFLRLSAVPVGFSNDNVLALRFDRGPSSTPADDEAFERAVLARLPEQPGIESAAIGVCPPLTQMCEVAGIFNIDDAPRADFGNMSEILAYGVSPEYFETLGTRIVEGRGFLPQDAAGGPVAIVNETAARELFSGDALGHRIAITHELTANAMATVIGVVEDVQYASLEEEIIPAFYFDRAAARSSYGTILVRTAGDPMAALDAVRRVVGEIAPNLPLTDVATLETLRLNATARTRTVLLLLIAFAAAGLLLSALGLYGLVSYAVVRRTREMGVRIALGASAVEIVRIVVRSPVFIALVGALLGILGALTVTRYAQALLFGVEPTDARVLGGAALTLIGVAFVAAVVPALRALRIDPAEALRSE